MQPDAQRVAHVRRHRRLELLTPLVRVQRNAVVRDSTEVERHAGVVGRRLDAQAELRVERVRRSVQQLARLPDADRPFDADRPGLEEGDVEAVVAGERRLEHLLLHVAVDRDRQLGAALPEPDQRVLLGELLEREPKPVPRIRVDRLDHCLQRRRRELLPRDRVRAADAVADLDVVQPPHLRDLARGCGLTAHRPAVVEDLELGHLGVADAVTHAHGAREQAHPGDLLPLRTAVDLEHGGVERSIGVARARRQVPRDRRAKLFDAFAGERRAVQCGLDDCAPRQIGERLRHVDVLAVEVGGKEPVVVLGELLDVEPPERHGMHAETRPNLFEHALDVCAGAVGLVDEEHRRDPQALQRAHEHERLRLHAFDGGHDEHDAVEHAEHALDLGDEVRVAGRVDQVDGDVVDRERDDRRLDRDPSLALERERVGLRRPAVDAAGRGDHTGVVEKPLGECGLTGVYMRQDPEVQSCVQHGSYPPKVS